MIKENKIKQKNETGNKNMNWTEKMVEDLKEPIKTRMECVTVEEAI